MNIKKNKENVLWLMQINIYRVYICSLMFPRMGSMLLEIFPVSPRGFESFTRRLFRLSFWSHFQERGWVVYVVLASLSRVRFGECLLGEFLQSEQLVGWDVQEVWSILWLRVVTVMRLTSRLSPFRENWALSIRSLHLHANSDTLVKILFIYLAIFGKMLKVNCQKSLSVT